MTPMAMHDVYIDDFLSLVQVNAIRRRQFKHSLLGAIAAIFRALDRGDDMHCQDPISDNKLRKGDGTWANNKLVLGWILDYIANTITNTIDLPPHCSTRLQALLQSLPRSKSRTSTMTRHKIMGELRSMTLGFPGTT
jgi:hypothetical protein